jgi:hypothetical protein
MLLNILVIAVTVSNEHEYGVLLNNRYGDTYNDVFFFYFSFTLILIVPIGTFLLLFLTVATAVDTASSISDD